MRIIIIIITFFINLQSLTKANDIREFEIEGISIGDSLLNFAEEKKILSSISSQQYPNDKFIIYEADNYLNIEKYDYIGVTTLKDDKDYIVTSVSGMINYKNLQECLNLKKEIQNSIEEIIIYDEKEEVKYQMENNDGTIYGVQYYLKPYPFIEAIVINCYHFTTESKRTRNLSVSANSEIFAKFLTKEAYK